MQRILARLIDFRSSAAAGLAVLLAMAVGPASLLLGQPAQRSETRVFPLSAGELVVVQNDYGSVTVRGANVTQAQVTLKRKAREESRLREVELITAKAADRLFLQSFFFDYQGESVDFDVEVPYGARVVVWGANPRVELSGLDDYVRVQTMTGDITASDLTGSVSLLSEMGDINVRLGRQPSKDIRLESVGGSVSVETAEGVDLFGYARAGGVLKWGREIEMTSGKLSRDLGDGAGPLLYASSLEGDVSVQTSGSLQSAPRRAPSPPVVAQRDDDGSQSGTYGSSSSSSGGTQDDPNNRRPASYDPDADQRTSGRSGGYDPADERRGPPPTLGGEPDRRAEPDPGTEPYGRDGRTDTGTASSRTETGSVPEYTVAKPGEAGTDATPIFRSSVNLIHLNVAVSDRRNNRSVAHLRPNDFSIYEDGQLQEIERFDNTEAPFNLLLLLDVSGSTKQHIDLIQDASIDFTREIKSNDRIAVATFNNRVRLIQRFTNDRYEVANAIQTIRSNGGTHFYDALYVSVNEYLRGVEGRKAVVVFTDGVDNRISDGRGSKVSFRQLYRSVQEVDTTIYTIFLDTRNTVGGSSGGGGVGGIVDIILGGGNPRGRRPRRTSSGVDRQYEEARDQLQLIADQTGGRMYEPRGIRDLSRVYSEIADDLRVQYSMAYSSTNPSQDGTWRSIRVEVEGRNLVARTRKGYYATPTNGNATIPDNRFVPHN
ncbi:MAG TPA: VWA domain-containing protein [Acidobacteriota bacterium]|nr:VWA domain-containing protein [Acidobacteriota bacterium]